MATQMTAEHQPKTSKALKHFSSRQKSLADGETASSATDTARSVQG